MSHPLDTDRHNSHALRWLILAFAALAMLAIAPAPIAAQILPSSDTAQPAAPAAADPFDRQTPRSTVTALLKALAAEDYERAANYFPGVADLSRASEIAAASPDEATPPAPTAKQLQRQKKAAELARKLKIALDAGGKLTPFAILSKAPEGQFNDGLAPTLEAVGSFNTADDTVPILLQYVEIAQTGEMQWRIAPETAEALDQWVPSPGAMAAERNTSTHVGGAPLMDWLLLIGLAAALFLGLRLVAAVLLAVLRKFIKDHERNAFYRLAHAALPPLALYLAVAAFFILAGRMEVAIIARQTLLRGAGIAAWVSLGWFMLRLIDAAARIATERMRRAKRRQAASIIILLRRAAKFLLLAVVAIAIFDTFGVDVTTGIAALGIGGLALALGAQKTIENLVGSATIIADSPLQVGDAAQIGEVFGTVEDIGMRSTRVRTINRTLVTIPNGYLAAERIENYSARDQFLFRQTIGVSYDTDAAKLQIVLSAFRAILADNAHIVDEGARVRFIGFADSSLSIELNAYFRTNDFAESLEMQEDLLLALMRKLEELGVSIAFPTRTIMLPNGELGNGSETSVSKTVGEN